MNPSSSLRLLSVVVLCGALFVPGSGGPLPSTGDAPLHLVADAPRLEPAGDGRRVIPRIHGFGSVSRPGEPSLPVQVLLVAIPEGSVPEIRIL